MIPDWAMAFAEPPARRRAGRTGRDKYRVPRQRKLTHSEPEAIHILASDQTLCELAADFDMSHETVRAVLRRLGRSSAGAVGKATARATNSRKS